MREVFGKFFVGDTLDTKGTVEVLRESVIWTYRVLVCDVTSAYRGG